MELVVVAIYAIALLALAVFGLHGLVMVYHYHRLRPRDPVVEGAIDRATFPLVTVQLPIFNELHVAARLVDAVCVLDYPRDRLEIQLLDDSTDETRSLLARVAAEKRALGHRIEHIVRDDRSGFKAGALRAGLERASGELIAIFDADFVPPPDFLLRTVPHLMADPALGMVQTRWEHLNHDYSILTRVQAIALDAHFTMEQQVRNRARLFINFNGTAGVWRRSCIVDAGDWQADTLTEDLDLSYRAQLRGWRFLYLNDVAVPAELPAEIHGLKSQQFRWTKGAIETSRKHLGDVWRSRQPFRVKMQATGHLSSNLIFPFIILVCLLHMPVMVLKNTSPGLAGYIDLLSVFSLSSIVTLLFHASAQRDIRADWRRRMLLFPIFVSSTMGLAVGNTRAVMEALLGRRSEFRRTPKYSIVRKGDGWKGSRYRQTALGIETVVELALAMYVTACIGVSIHFGEIAMIPFQLMFLFGFGLTGILSLRDARAGAR